MTLSYQLNICFYFNVQKCEVAMSRERLPLIGSHRSKATGETLKTLSHLSKRNFDCDFYTIQLLSWWILCFFITKSLVNSLANRHKRSRHHPSSTNPHSSVLLDTSVAPWGGGTLLKSSFATIPLPPPPPTPPAPRPTPSSTPYHGRRKTDEKGSSPSLSRSDGALLNGTATEEKDGLFINQLKLLFLIVDYLIIHNALGYHILQPQLIWS